MISFDVMAPVPDDVLAIAFVDTTYPNFGDDPDGVSERLREKIEAEIGAKISEVDIYPGASGPGWLFEFPWQEVAATAAAYHILFSGKNILENLDAWSEIAGRIRRLLGRPACLSRSAAASLAIDEVLSLRGQKKANEVRLLSYSIADARYEKWIDAREANESTPVEPMSVTIHVFEIDFDGEVYLAVVDRAEVGVHLRNRNP